MKRPPLNSAKGMVDAMAAAAAGPLDPPKHVRLRRRDRPFWDGIVRARARMDWDDHELVVAAQLARCQCDIETESRKLDKESSVVENARGTPVANPRVSVLEQLARREMALMRSLRMGGRVAGDAMHEAQRAKVQRQAEEALHSVSDEDMLA